MAEQFLEDCFTKEKIKLDYVVHLGAEWAQETEVYNKFGAEFVLWVDALWNKESMAVRKYLDKATFKWRWANNAICNEDFKNKIFWIYNHPAASSLYQPDKMNEYYPDHKIVGRINVNSITVDTLLKSQNIPIDRVNFVAMDVQGSELHAIQYGKTLFGSPNLQAICVEVVYEDIYKDGAGFHDINNLLEKYGFVQKYVDRHEPTYEGIESVPQADVFYTRG